MTKRIAKLVKGAVSRTPDFFELVGLATVAFGVGMIFLPAGVIVAGAALCFIGYAMGNEDA